MHNYWLTEENLKDFLYRISNGNPENVENHVFPISSKTKLGIGHLKNEIHKRLVKKGYKTPFKIQM